MALIDEFLPVFEFVERHAVDVRAPRVAVDGALRRVDLAESRLIRALLWLRGLPARRSADARAPARTRLTLDTLERRGFTRLADRPEEEVVFGVVGRFWAASGGRAAVDAAGFKAFARPGVAKAAWNFALASNADGTTRLSTETRIHCPDRASLRRVRVYWLAVRPGSGLIRRAVLRAVKRLAEGA
jgi:hypothetical protein